MSKEEVNFLVDQVVADLERVLAEQRDIRAKTEDLAKSSAPDGKPDATLRSSPLRSTSARALRDVKGLAPRQDALRKGMESVEFDLSVLKRWAETDARHETRQSIFAAHDAARRSRVPQKMTNAIVAYSEFDLRAASREQKAAERSMAGILEKVQDAYASMASDPLSELKAAEIEARKIEENLAALTGRAKPDDDGGDGKQDGEEQSGGRQDGREQDGTERGGERQGEETVPAIAPATKLQISEPRACSPLPRIKKRGM